jgi:ATP-dependent RNA helicase DeaD
MIDTEFGVPGDNVGRIDIMDSYSFISVPLKEAEMILDAFNNIKKEGGFATVRVERASEDKNADRYPKSNNRGSSSRGGYKGKPRSGNGGGYKGKRD